MEHKIFIDILLFFTKINEKSIKTMNINKYLLMCLKLKTPFEYFSS